jgi:hypothetical protein
VARWRSSDQQRRWCAATLQHIERQFRRVKGAKHLPLLIKALRPTMQTSNSAAA